MVMSWLLTGLAYIQEFVVLKLSDVGYVLKGLSLWDKCYCLAPNLMSLSWLDSVCLNVSNELLGIMRSMQNLFLMILHIIHVVYYDNSRFLTKT